MSKKDIGLLLIFIPILSLIIYMINSAVLQEGWLVLLKSIILPVICIVSIISGIEIVSREEEKEEHDDNSR